MTKRKTAALLAFVLGIFGTHYFYANKFWRGIFMFLFFISFATDNDSEFVILAFILSLVSGIKYLNMTDEEFYNYSHQKSNNNYGKMYRHKSEKMENKTNRPKYSHGPQVSKRRENIYLIKGIEYYKNYEIEKAIEEFKKALKTDPKDEAVLFNLTCAFSLLEDKENAICYMTKTLECGVTKDKIISHDDLAFLRIQPEFKEYMEIGVDNFDTTNQGERNDLKIKNNMGLLNNLKELEEKKQIGSLTEKEYLFEKEKILRK